MTATTLRRFVGQNIKGWPKMPARHVAHDLRQLAAKTDAAVVQEFRWPAYWHTLGRVLAAALWAVYPTRGRGAARPTRGAQAVMWRRSMWRAIDHRTRLLHPGDAGLSEDRYLRAVLLEDKATGLAAWHGGTHFVVNGDRASDGPVARRMLAHDFAQLDEFLTDLTRGGRPVIFELDANVALGSAAYRPFLDLLDDHDARIIGTHGIEYLIVIDGLTVVVDVARDWIIPTTKLYTDHEGRGITYRLKTR